MTTGIHGITRQIKKGERDQVSAALTGRQGCSNCFCAQVARGIPGCRKSAWPTESNACGCCHACVCRRLAGRRGGARR